MADGTKRSVNGGFRTMLRRRAAAFGLDRPEARAWAMYDWANSAFATTIVAAVLPVYYGQVATAGLPEGSGLTLWSYTNSAALLIVALMSPLLGATADLLGAKKRFLETFVAIGVSGTVALFFVREGDWLFASLAFIVGFVGFAGANVFYDSLLSAVAPSNGDISAISLGLSIYALISIAAYFIEQPWHFWVLAFAVATVQGGTQAVSRSLFSDLVPKARSSEFFGLFSVMNKFAGIFGPLLVGAVNQVSGNSRLSILSLIVFFVGGLIVLGRVDVEAGRAAAADEGHLGGATNG